MHLNARQQHALAFRSPLNSRIVKVISAGSRQHQAFHPVVWALIPKKINDRYEVA